MEASKECVASGRNQQCMNSSSMRFFPTRMRMIGTSLSKHVLYSSRCYIQAHSRPSAVPRQPISGPSCSGSARVLGR